MNPRPSEELAALLRERQRLYLEWALFLVSTAALFRLASMLERELVDVVAVFVLVGLGYSVLTVGFVQRFGTVMSHTCPRCYATLHGLLPRLVSRKCGSCGLTPYTPTVPPSDQHSA